MDSEKKLIERVRQGQSDAFGPLYEKYADPVYAFVYWKVHHKETAQDITARAFIKALEGIGGLTPAENAFRPWIYTIARNAVTDHWRTTRPTLDIEDAWDLASDDDVERDVEARMRLAGVRQYLQGLDPLQRDIVLLRVWSDLPYEEIGAIVGKRPDNCKVIFSRVVRRMRADLAVLLAMAVMRLYL